MPPTIELDVNEDVIVQDPPILEATEAEAKVPANTTPDEANDIVMAEDNVQPEAHDATEDNV